MPRRGGKKKKTDVKYDLLMCINAEKDQIGGDIMLSGQQAVIKAATRFNEISVQDLGCCPFVIKTNPERKYELPLVNRT